MLALYNDNDYHLYCSFHLSGAGPAKMTCEHNRDHDSLIRALVVSSSSQCADNLGPCQQDFTLRLAGFFFLKPASDVWQQYHLYQQQAFTPPGLQKREHSQSLAKKLCVIDVCNRTTDVCTAGAPQHRK